MPQIIVELTKFTQLWIAKSITESVMRVRMKTDCKKFDRAIEMYKIESATEAQLDQIKAIADENKDALGYIRPSILMNSIRDNELLIARENKKEDILGFIRYHHRRDRKTTIYSMAVREEFRGLRIGRYLLTRVLFSAIDLNHTTVQLKCPADLPANKFYEKMRFKLDRTEQGKKRELNVWTRTYYYLCGCGCNKGCGNDQEVPCHL